MKKSTIITLGLLILTAFIFLGCTSKPEPVAEEDPRSRIMGAEGVPRPSWMNRPPVSNDLHYVIGDGRVGMTKAAQQSTARTDGLSKLAQWKEAVVMDTMKNYIEESGVPGNTQTLINFQQTTITKSKANIVGFNLEEYWIDQDGIYHGLFSYPKANLKNDFEVSIGDFQRTQAAAFADFKAQEAFKLLEAQMNEPGR
ncbi:MAG: LPP20 family lipoprotein [Treponema sp.]|nr:LPP20 family lipoprotein [Treponema sp.]